MWIHRYNHSVSQVYKIYKFYCSFFNRSKILHLNKLATQIVQQMARVHIPDPPPPPRERSPLPSIEIDLTTVHDRLNDLDHMVTALTKLMLEKEETVLYVVNKRPGKGEFTTSVHSPTRVAG
jgi:hypothetical protein